MSEEGEQQAQALRTQVYDELKDFFHDQFRDMKRDIQAEGEWATESIRKKVRQDNIVTFKSLHNKKQYSFTTEIDHLLDCIQKAVVFRDATKAKKFITQAQAKVKHRNKLICLADGSSAGWATVQEYERSEVASDDKDDRRIRKAEERAKSKLEKARLSSNSNFDHSFQSFRNFRGGTGRLSWRETCPSDSRSSVTSVARPVTFLQDVAPSTAMANDPWERTSPVQHLTHQPRNRFKIIY